MQWFLHSWSQKYWNVNATIIKFLIYPVDNLSVISYNINTIKLLTGGFQ